MSRFMAGLSREMRFLDERSAVVRTTITRSPIKISLVDASVDPFLSLVDP